MNITEINDNNLDEIIQNNTKIILDCYAPWCSSCKMLLPVFEELSAEENHVKFCKINIDENPDVSERFDVMSIPTVLFFENGELKNRQSGLKNKEELKRLFLQ
ncbi:MAG: thioredoxin [Ruminococcus sp.]|nr:thioredoxin [Candidatus Copronaster equi]